jgi:hypothetical protein
LAKIAGFQVGFDSRKVVSMPDDLSKRRPQDSSRINVHEAWELEYWCRVLGKTPQQLMAAVQAVGTSVDAVKKYFGRI